MTTSDISHINDLLDNSQRVVLLSHANPDGDAIGSVLAMTAYLKKRGLDPVPMLPDAMPASYRWMPHASSVWDAQIEPQRCEKALKEAQVVFCFDFNGANRVEGLKNALEEANGVKVLIDHHPNPSNAFDHILSDTKASSAAELVYQFIHALNGNKMDVMDLNIAQCIYVGMMTDTGSFNYNAGNPQMYSVLKHLIETGVDPARMHQMVYNNFSVNRMRFLGHSLLNKMVVISHCATAFIHVSLSDLKQFQHEKGDTEGLVNYPLSIKGILFSALFTERNDYIKASFRSHYPFNVNQFAKDHFNGGGHVNAAGGKSFQSMEQTIEQFESLVNNEYLNELKNAQRSNEHS